ncbi:uncharacterized protein LOC143218762 isoform X2 [Lasioglossum baleicum]|uniref:uncharacterized protein LOC143218762 isoform X2 n=1 Tax=Lasioglossum baleicum TaxID=434251 RepID=UPI003FCE53DC
MNQQKIHVDEESGCAKDARGISSTSPRPSEELNKANIILTNRGLQRYGTWSKARLLELITSKFKQFAETQSSRKTCFNETTNERRLWVTIHSGLYSTIVLNMLLNKGMSIHAIIKAMKLGLVSLNSCELSYFRCFNIYPYMLEFEDMWTSKYNPELISNLRAIGITEPDCWRIIIYGVGFQSACILRYLLLSGIDIPGILNWQSPVNRSSEKVILFLKHIGIEQEVIELAEKYGIDEETEQILTDLGLEQMEKESSHVGSTISFQFVCCICLFIILNEIHRK